MVLLEACGTHMGAYINIYIKTSTQKLNEHLYKYTTESHMTYMAFYIMCPWYTLTIFRGTENLQFTQTSSKQQKIFIKVQKLGG